MLREIPQADTAAVGNPAHTESFQEASKCISYFANLHYNLLSSFWEFIMNFGCCFNVPRAQLVAWSSVKGTYRNVLGLLVVTKIIINLSLF